MWISALTAPVVARARATAPAAPAPTPVAPAEPSAPPASSGAKSYLRAAPAVSADPALLDELKARRSALAAGGGGGSTAVARAAGRQYAKNGATTYDLRSREETKTLIERTPQLDRDKTTKSDAIRCGGAATWNALLADGRFAQNAEAIRKTAGDVGRTLSPAETKALDAYGKGKLSPNEAARLQDLVYDLGARPAGADGVARFEPGTGLTSVGMAELSARLRKNGAFGNTDQMRFMRSEREGFDHWTVNHLDQQGRVLHTDSWPERDGKATVLDDAHGPGHMSQDGAANPALKNDVQVYVVSGAGNTNTTGYMIRDHGDGTSVREYFARVDPKRVPTASDFDQREVSHATGATTLRNRTGFDW